MKRYTLFSCLFVLLGFSACQLKEVVNPNITEDTFIGSDQSASIWLNGTYRQLALVLNEVVVDAEITSDNYYNNSSLSNKVFDIPTILYSDLDVDNMQRAIGKLREMGSYGIEKIFPSDRLGTPSVKAEMYFLRGYAYLLGAETMNGLPMTANGRVGETTELLDSAINDFKQAVALHANATLRNSYNLALARAYYQKGDKTNAVAYAAIVKNANPLQLLQAVYDGQNGVSNTMQTYTYSSSTNTFAPLPRLDFLDPKLYHTGNITTDQKPISILKGEEAYLIMAEAALGNQQLAEAKTTLKSLLTDVVAKRPTVTIFDTLEKRKGNRSDYAQSAAVKVKADAGATAVSGRILDRSAAAGGIKVYTISGTSVTAADIDAAGTIDELLYILCLMRQEIFISEGRRMTDLGIRFPVSQVEQLNNPNVTNAQTIATIPAYIPAATGMDNFSYDKTAGIVTIKYDMNKILVQNKNSKGVLPLLK
ncbi:RagB/SusD family nutrient uptake outer membrane protein [Filimonas effusa]|uniref:Tetratricopeptide repeat protein n=1 Tax=Filimonas effusa TaxID=2508721 RepID=A0A4Q1DBZ7_9BACT|nr:tetratricopeptide repeat protein [Filimonas effusa]RXK86049.1 tetratricopeptide repeat protein [Filimonas effusa]